MPFRVFAVPTTDDGANAEVLNAFLRTVRVVSVERQLVSQGQQAAWPGHHPARMWSCGEDGTTPPRQ